MIDQATIKQARQTDLAAYLLAMGEPLARDGSTRHKHKAHNSLVFKENAYFWNSKGESGNAVDYLTRHMGMNFEEAILALIDFEPPKEIAGKEKKEVGRADNFRRVFAYLHRTRHISNQTIQRLIDARLLEQEAETNNAVFLMRNEHGEEVGAELEGTLSERRFKGIRAGSEYGYGFNVLWSGHEVGYCLFFESAVDLLSFAEIKATQGKTLANCLLVSMVGLKPNIVQHMTATFRGQPIICPDNDQAADEFLATMKIKSLRPNPAYKDWNEQLKCGGL